MTARALVALLGLVGVGCATNAPPVAAPASLDRTAWVLVHVETPEGLAGRLPDTMPMLQFEAGRVTGSDGCNRLGGAASLRRGAVAFGPLTVTRAACPAPVQSLAGRLERALSRQTFRTSYSLDGLELVLTSPMARVTLVRGGPEGYGPDSFDDAGVIACDTRDDLDEACGVRVVRTDDEAVLWISNVAIRAYPGYRVLTAADGAFTAQDGTPVRVSAADGAWVLTVGREWYEIPFALVTGE